MRRQQWIWKDVDYVSIWKVVIAIFGLLDLYVVLLSRHFDALVVDNDDTVDSDKNNSSVDSYSNTCMLSDDDSITTNRNNDENGSCRNPTDFEASPRLPLSITIDILLRKHYDAVVGTVPFLFCLICILEAIRRVRNVYVLGYENAALDVFEQQLSKWRWSEYRGVTAVFSSTKLFTGEGNFNAEVEQKKFVHVWIPVAYVVVSWFCLIPWVAVFELAMLMLPSTDYQSATSQISILWTTKDKAITSICMSFWLRALQTCKVAVLTYIIHNIKGRIIRKAFRHPIRVFRGYRKVLAYIRYIRFAGPLLRMLDKIQQQVRALYDMKQQLLRARLRRTERVQHRSLLQNDLRRIASIDRVQARFRSVKSQLFNAIPTQYQDLLRTKVGDQLRPERERQVQRSQQVQWLQGYVDQDHSNTNLAGAYDQLVDLSGSTSGFHHAVDPNATHDDSIATTHDPLHGGDPRWQSRLFGKKTCPRLPLLPPNSRFGLSWRIVISVCLIVELLRLTASWRFAGDYSVSMTELLQRLICNATEDRSNVNNTGGRKIDPKRTIHVIGKWISTRILHKNRDDNIDRIKAAVCSDWLTMIIMVLGRCLENSIDWVCFIDIFVWFSTGELNEKSRLVPKPFFARFIIPGTLVQVLDHPTVPGRIPGSLAKIVRVTDEIGFARVIRWGLVILPVLRIYVWIPFKEYILLPAVGYDQFSSTATTSAPLSGSRQLSKSFRGSFLY